MRKLGKWYVVKCTQGDAYWWEVRRDIQLFWFINYTIRFNDRIHLQEIYAIQACNTANGSEMELVVEKVDIN